MKKLTLSLLAVLFIFSLSTVFVSCGSEEDAEKTANDLTNQATEELDKKVEEVTEEVTEVVDYTAGKTVYVSKCQVCHQENGEGMGETFPALKGKAIDLKIVLNGAEGTAMAAFKDQLSDQEIADVTNYVNHAWDNNFDNVTVEDVAAAK